MNRFVVIIIFSCDCPDRFVAGCECCSQYESRSLCKTCLSKNKKDLFWFFLWTVLIILFSELIMASKVSSGAVDDSYEDSSNPFLPVSRFYLLK